MYQRHASHLRPGKTIVDTPPSLVTRERCSRSTSLRHPQSRRSGWHSMRHDEPAGRCERPAMAPKRTAWQEKSARLQGEQPMRDPRPRSASVGWAKGESWHYYISGVFNIRKVLIYDLYSLKGESARDESHEGTRAPRFGIVPGLIAPYIIPGIFGAEAVTQASLLRPRAWRLVECKRQLELVVRL